VVFGVRKPLANWNPFWANLQVYDYLLFDACKTTRWKDKLGVWFRRTGWRPADVAAQYPKQSADLSDFRKYDDAPTKPMQYYVMLQFIAAMALTLAIGRLFATAGAGAVVVPCLMLWAQLYVLGIMNEGRASAVTLELLRLLVIVPAGVALMGLSSSAFLITAAGYVAVSISLLIVSTKAFYNK
jgi:hypothetical protein